jgi:hypothetical protein
MSHSSLERPTPFVIQTRPSTWPHGFDDEPEAAPEAQSGEMCDLASDRRQRVLDLVRKFGPASVTKLWRRSGLGYDFGTGLAELVALGRVVRFSYRGRDYVVAADFQGPAGRRSTAQQV